MKPSAWLWAMVVLGTVAADTPSRAGASTNHAATTRALATAKAAAAPTTASRSLSDIHIEGEIAVPQVLFITARDQRRFMEFQHRRYFRTSRALGEQTVLPSRISVLTAPAAPVKETPR